MQNGISSKSRESMGRQFEEKTGRVLQKEIFVTRPLLKSIRGRDHTVGATCSQTFECLP
jgi:hypothetical protein